MGGRMPGMVMMVLVRVVVVTVTGTSPSAITTTTAVVRDGGEGVGRRRLTSPIVEFRLSRAPGCLRGIQILRLAGVFRVLWIVARHIPIPAPASGVNILLDGRRVKVLRSILGRARPHVALNKQKTTRQRCHVASIGMARSLDRGSS